MFNQHLYWFAIITPLLTAQINALEVELHRDERVDELIRLLKDNESLFAEIEVTLIDNYSIGEREPSMTSFGAEVASSRLELTSTSQGWYFRADEIGETRTATEILPTNKTVAFDGEFTRLLQGSAANRISVRQIDSSIVWPHMLVLRDRRFAFPLSAYLTGSKAIRPLVNADHWPMGREITVAYEGEETFEDLLCHKIYVTTLVNGSPYNGERLWLAESRNYLPVLCHSFTDRVSREIPQGISVASDLRQIAPGIWFPFNINCTFGQFPNSVVVGTSPKKTSTQPWGFWIKTVYQDGFSQKEFPDGCMDAAEEDIRVVRISHELVGSTKPKIFPSADDGNAAGNRSPDRFQLAASCRSWR